MIFVAAAITPTFSSVLAIFAGTLLLSLGVIFFIAKRNEKQAFLFAVSAAAGFFLLCVGIITQTYT